MSIRYSRKRPPKSCTRVADYRFDKDMPIGGVVLSTDVENGVDVTFFSYNSEYNRSDWYDNCIYYDFPNTEQGENDAYKWCKYLESLIDEEQEKYLNEMKELEELYDYDDFD